jgi:hypothetical protein
MQTKTNLNLDYDFNDDGYHKCACNTGYEATPTATPTSCESEYTYMNELDDINVSN